MAASSDQRSGRGDGVSDHMRDRLRAAVGDRYVIEGEVGRGGMAAVYRASDVRLARTVAIKVLPPELAFNGAVRSRFLREAQTAAGLTHPNIVPIYTVDEAEGLVYFVMAFVDGESVAYHIAVSGAMPADRVRPIVAGVADALDYAHSQRVIHRDIKPDNILIDRSGKAMVTDFGIARAAADEARLTVTGVAVGTPAYMSPEQAMGEREIDGRSDIYSLGVVAYQMLAGETPFKAANTPAMLMKHVSEPPRPLLEKRPDIPAGLAAAIERALEKRPEDRHQTGAEMRAAVLGQLSDGPRAGGDSRASSPAHSSRPIPPAAQRPMHPAPLPPPLQPEHATKRGKRSETTITEKVARFRRRFAGSMATIAMLFGINAVTAGYPWFIFPTLAILVGLATQLGSLWGDGVPLRRVFLGSNRDDSYSDLEPGGVDHGIPPGEVAPPGVMLGIHGIAIRRAIANRQAIVDVLERISAPDRKMLPEDILATASALVDRVTGLAGTLHRVDEDAHGSKLGALDDRIDELKRQGDLPERARRLGLLERQRATLGDLLERRGALMSQLESASLALENLKLDLIRFRTAGVSAALEDVTSATREARSVSREIGHVLDAVDEVKRI